MGLVEVETTVRQEVKFRDPSKSG